MSKYIVVLIGFFFGFVLSFLVTKYILFPISGISATNDQISTFTLAGIIIQIVFSALFAMYGSKQ